MSAANSTGTKKPAPELPGLDVLEEIARSPRGITYKARRQVEQDVVAVKSIRRGLCSRQFVAEMPHNAEASFLLEHAGIVRGLGCVDDGKFLLLLMELAPGESLARLLKQNLPVRVSKALRTVLYAASALHHAGERGKIHGRLHPADIVLAADGQTRVLGIGYGERPAQPAWVAADPYLFEPLIYTAPEALPSRPFPTTFEAQASTDIYALGAIFFHLLTGTPPFRGRDEAALAGERAALKGPVHWPSSITVSGELRALADRMLAPDPELRPGYAALLTALKDALRTCEQSEAVAAAAEREASHKAAVAISRAKPLSGRAPDLWRKQEPQAKHFPYTAALAVLTAIVFTAAITRIYFVPGASGETVQAPAPAPKTTPVAPAVPSAVPPQPLAVPATRLENIAPPPPPVFKENGEAALASRQLEVLQGLLRKGVVKPSSAVVRMVNGFADKAGRDTPDGIKALLFAAELEEGLASNVTPPQTQTAAQPVSAPKQPEPAAAPQTALPEKGAPAAQPQAPFLKTAPDLAAQEVLLAKLVKGAQEKAAAFHYDDALAALAGPEAGAETRKTLESYGALIRREQALFARCRKRLRDEIERSPRHESPLQVFPRKNDPVGDDIVDFDEKGLVIESKHAGTSGRRIQEWAKVPSEQARRMLSLLADAKSLDDQLALAVFCQQRGLAVQRESALATAGAFAAAKELTPELAAKQKEQVDAVAGALKSLEALGSKP